QPDGFGEVADARLAALVRRDDREQAHARRVAERLEHARELHGGLRVGGLAHQRRAARTGLTRTGRGDVREGQGGDHASILPRIEGCGYVDASNFIDVRSGPWRRTCLSS